MSTNTPTQTRAYVIQVQNLDDEWQDSTVFDTSIWGDAQAASLASLRAHRHLSPEDAAQGTITLAPIRRIYRTEVVCPE